MKIDLPSLVFFLLGPLLLVTAWRVLGREVIDQWAPALMAVIAIGWIAVRYRYFIENAEIFLDRIQILRGGYALLIGLGTLLVGLAIAHSGRPSFGDMAILSWGLVMGFVVEFLIKRNIKRDLPTTVHMERGENVSVGFRIVRVTSALLLGVGMLLAIVSSSHTLRWVISDTHMPPWLAPLLLLLGAGLGLIVEFSRSRSKVK
jgi:hypothetical protein